MPEIPLKNQIIEWLKIQPYWLQYSANHLLEDSMVVNQIIDNAYIFLKQDIGVEIISEERAPIIFNEIIKVNDIISNTLTLNTIHSIENVNALESGQSIDINKNLTIIYGNNGSGKSGYIRMLNNAFNTRGDKTLIGNVFNSENNGEPKCKFIFQTTTEPYEKEFPKDKDSFEFSQFTAFDTHSVKIHLDNDNQLNFVPTGFEFFEDIEILFEELKTKLIHEIQENRPRNNFIIHFKNENQIKNVVLNLGTNTDIEELSLLSDFSQADTNQLEEINIKIAELKALNIQSKIEGFEQLQLELNHFILNQQSIIDLLSAENVQNYINLISRYHQLKELSKEQGIKNLEEYEIEIIGSSEWRDFILASKNYADVIEKQRQDGFSYPKEEDNCLFCLQPLSEKENLLIQKYWQFLISEVEKEIIKVTLKIKQVLSVLENLKSVIFDETTNLFSYLNSKDPELATKWKTIAKKCEDSRQNIIKNLKNINNDLPAYFFEDNANEFNQFTILLKQEKDVLFAKNTPEEIATLTIQSNYLSDKYLLSILLPDILKFIEKHKWSSNAEQNLGALKTNSITSFQGALFAKHITEKYTEKFNEECKTLNAPMVIDIVQQNSKLKTFRKLQIAKQTASQILSEGEQRAISLADFLAEVQLNTKNTGVVFDDPVTSLDHHRREVIAERLVKLSVSKQVVIFTHDISFLSKLTSYAKTIEDLSITITSIRKFGNTIGIIKPELPWIAQKISDRTKYLRNDIVKLKRLVKEGEEDEYNKSVKGWYGLLREAWERCVEERLFKGAIERFSGEVHTKPLSKIEITAELVSMINEGMTQSSKWVHDQAMGLNPVIPNIAKVEEDFNKILVFSEKCKVD